MTDTSSASGRILSFEVDARILQDLDLFSTTARLVPTADGKHVEDGESRLNAFLLSALSVARASFPKLTEAQWLEILNTEVFRTGRNALQMDALDAWIREHADDPKAGPAVRTLASLNPAERLAVTLVVHHAWRPFRGDLRDVLSVVSHLPQECVLAGDPDVSDLWKIDAAWAEAEKIFVRLIFNDEVKALCHYEICSDDEIVYVGAEISHHGYFSPAETSLPAYLHERALRPAMLEFARRRSV